MRVLGEDADPQAPALGLGRDPEARREQQGSAVDDLEQVVRQRAGPGIGPLEVLEHERHRVALRERLDPGAAGADDILRDVVARVPGMPPLASREKDLEVGKHLRQARAEQGLQLDAQAGPDGEGGVSLLEPQPAHQRLDHGEEEELPAVGDAVPLEPGHGVSGEPSQLAEEPRLADAGIPQQ
jgi:hypothetical protein